MTRCEKGIDITGQKYNRLTAIKLERHENGVHWWRVRCDCGNEKVISKGSFMHGKAKSCGCLQREVRASRRKLGW